MTEMQQAVAASNPAGSGVANVARHCYYCRCKHPPELPMRRVDTPCGVRWRCVASIEAARKDPALREAWGRAKSTANSSSNRRSAEYLNALRRQREIT
ncbi:MAG: hypothetical protein U1A72_09565 [Sulfuritalea sp.]|nr:hypothetical protein [Sulfuritalea sp.]